MPAFGHFCATSLWGLPWWDMRMDKGSKGWLDAGAGLSCWGGVG